MLQQKINFAKKILSFVQKNQNYNNYRIYVIDYICS